MSINVQKLIPQFVFKLRAKQLLLPVARYWFNYDVNFCNLSYSNESILSALLVDSHVIEKGLTMPNRRYGFGQDKVRTVIKNCSRALKTCSQDSIQIQTTLDDLNEYLSIHEKAKYTLPNDIVSGIKELLPYRLNNNEKNCYDFKKEEFFRPYNTFEEFAHSRHTVRNYSGDPVSLDVLKKCVELAQTAPSACNRQSTRVKIIASQKIKEFIIEAQNGNRGFGQFVDKVIMITGERSAYDLYVRQSMYLDAGIFTMNLLYALHANKICACTLNAHFTPSKIKEIQEKMNLPKSEVPVVFIVVGNAPDEFRVAKSQRIKTDDILTVL